VTSQLEPPTSQGGYYQGEVSGYLI